MAEDPKLWLALSTSLVALGGTLYSTFANYRGQRDLERLKAELQRERDEREAKHTLREQLAKFRDPLMYAAYDLQSRIYNMLKGGFLELYILQGSAREQEYAIENTVFLFAQFLGWTELIRQEIQFLDFGAEDDTRQLRQLQDGIFTQLQIGASGIGFRLFAGEQRAIGELMIVTGPSGKRCMGYAAFCCARTPGLDAWLDPLRVDVRQMASDPQPVARRLEKVQHLLIDLLRFLDPEFVRFSEVSRSKV
jgi:hypothetical protein